MSKTFTVPLEPTTSDKEVYRAADENIVRIRVFLSNGRTVEAREATVELALTGDAMVALGSELIRAATGKSQTQASWEIRPSTSAHASEVLGVYCHPKSCVLVINKQPLGKVADLLK